MSNMAPTIIPRWEWRTFGETFGEAEAKIRSHGEAKARSSAETYIVSFDTPNNTKIRDGLLDVKKLEHVNTDKLEQWNPVLKSGFPLSGDILSLIYAAWNVKAPSSPRKVLTLEQFLAEVVVPHPRLTVVAVAKERFGFTVDGCIVELANLTFDGKPIRTAAVENEDAALVIATVRKLGLGGFENINYVKAIKRFRAVSVA